MSSGAPTLGPELERALVRELRATWHTLNSQHFGEALRAPALSLSDASSFLARWVPVTRHLEVSRDLVLDHPWGVVVEVLKHEMAHQFVHEVLGEDETPHGPAFRATCERLGIDARAQGLPQAGVHPDPAAARVVARVQKLLALAQSDNQHEAEAAAAAAQRLMLKHNLDEAQSDTEEAYGFRHLGRITGRVSEWERRLGNLLGEHFFVDVIWVPAFRPRDGKRGHVLEAIGSHANLELASYVHDFLIHSAERLWGAHKRSQGIQGNRDRRVYYAGVMAGFADKLRAQARRHRQQGLVWVPKAALSRYTKKRHPYVRTVRHGGHRPREAFGQGREAGRRIVLHRGVQQGTGGSGRRLLSG